MSENDKRQIGEGSDNLGQAAKQTANAAKQTSKAIAENAAAKGAEATTKAAAATVKAGVETGKAVANVAAGTAAGGPIGAIASALWSMRHTLFKILISITLAIVFIIVTVISLPSIIFENLFGLNNGDYHGGYSIMDAVGDLDNSVTEVVEYGYQLSLSKVEKLISDGGYDYDRSMNALTDNADVASGYDTYYIMSAYSVSVMQQGANKDDFKTKLTSVADLMFPVTYVVKEAERFFEDPLGYIFSEIFEFVECVIHPFDNSVILKAFNLDLDAEYGNFGITCGEAIDDMTTALKLSLSKGG